MWWIIQYLLWNDTHYLFFSTLRRHPTSFGWSSSGDIFHASSSTLQPLDQYVPTNYMKKNNIRKMCNKY